METRGDRAVIQRGERVALTGMTSDKSSGILDVEKKQSRKCITAYWFHNFFYALYTMAIWSIMIAQLSKETHNTIGEYEILILIGVLAGWSTTRIGIAGLSLLCRMIETKRDKYDKISWPSPGISTLWYLLLMLGYWWTFVVSYITYNEIAPDAALFGSTRARTYHANLWIIQTLTAIDAVLYFNSMFAVAGFADESTSIHRKG
jgi:hypothetical protein